MSDCICIRCAREHDVGESHNCDRILVAEHWNRGKVMARWHSDHPGSTGPDGLATQHRATADAGWQPPPFGEGWTYRWVEAPLQESATEEDA